MCVVIFGLEFGVDLGLVFYGGGELGYTEHIGASVLGIWKMDSSKGGWLDLALAWRHRLG